MSKFYRFYQNNSFGTYDSSLSFIHLIVEADSKTEAESVAFENGIYYNGVEDGSDCECCGDRWYTPDEYKSLDDIKEYYNLDSDKIIFKEVKSE